MLVSNFGFRNEHLNTLAEKSPNCAKLVDCTVYTMLSECNNHKTKRRNSKEKRLVQYRH